MDAYREQGAMMLGVVTRYTVKSGYGFIKVDDDGDDCFIHQSEIQTEGFRALKEGDKVQFIFSWRNSKPTATKVHARDGETLRVFKSKVDAEEACGEKSGPGARLLGTCKWFNQEKGYGFLSRDGISDGADVFFHINEVKGGESIQEGQRLQFSLGDAISGKLNAVNVTLWDNNQVYSPLENTPYLPLTPNYQSSSLSNSYAYIPPSKQTYNPSKPALPYTSPADISKPMLGFMRGNVKFYNTQKCFGFIFQGDREIYFGKNGLEADTPAIALTEGTLVDYKIKTGADGKQWATNVRLIGCDINNPKSENKYAPSYLSPTIPLAGYSAYGMQPHGHYNRTHMPSLGMYSQNQQPPSSYAQNGYELPITAPHPHSGLSQPYNQRSYASTSLAQSNANYESFY